MIVCNGIRGDWATQILVSLQSLIRREIPRLYSLTLCCCHFNQLELCISPREVNLWLDMMELTHISVA